MINPWTQKPENNLVITTVDTWHKTCNRPFEQCDKQTAQKEFPMLNSKAVFNLYKSNANVKKVLDYMTLNGKDQEKFFVEALVKALHMPRSEILAVFKDFETQCKMGSWLRGRVQSGQTRFETVYHMADVEKAMHDPKYNAGMPFRVSPKKERIPAKKVIAPAVQQETKETATAPKEVQTQEKSTVVPIRKIHRDGLAVAVQPQTEQGNFQSEEEPTLQIRPGFVIHLPKKGVSDVEWNRLHDLFRPAK